MTFLPMLMMASANLLGAKTSAILESQIIVQRIDSSFEEEWRNGCSIYCSLDSNALEISATSHLRKHGKIAYEGRMAHDFNFSTAWVEGDSNGFGIGQRLRFKVLQRSSRLAFTQIFIANGYHKSPQVWRENSRVKSMAIWVNGKRHAEFQLKDDMSFQKVEIPAIHFKDVGQGDLLIEFEVLSAYPGEKYKDLAISELNWDGIGHH